MSHRGAGRPWRPKDPVQWGRQRCRLSTPGEQDRRTEGRRRARRDAPRSEDRPPLGCEGENPSRQPAPSPGEYGPRGAPLGEPLGAEGGPSRARRTETGPEDQKTSRFRCGARPASSGKVVRHRLNPHGNREANRALHMVALNRLRRDPRAQAYAARRTAEGKSKRETMRCLKRYIVREVYRALYAPQAIAASSSPA